MTRPEPVALWEQTSQDLLTVLRDLSDDDWSKPALPGWSVQDVVAHLAHLESEVAGMPQPDGGHIDVDSAPNQAMPTDLTHVGVEARRGMSAEAVLAEFEQACVGRREVLAGLDLSDPKAQAPGVAGRLGWDLATLLRNRPIDMWVHEQDVREATGRPMTTTGVGAAYVAGIMTKVFPMTLRRLPTGTAVVAHITGPQGRTLAARVGEDGRATPFDPAEGSDVTLELDDITWLRLTGGRISPEEATVGVTGDEGTAAIVLGRLNVTP